ncbi:metalloendopeptidase OMA1, mitochondrial-like [Hetaerina americana]|uniref:metalloendopeptidase OMA1, mitochondrial-like n=1 Tax=Hetaerina americana TaxID=62018 RepID=UPI003A7F4296
MKSHSQVIFVGSTVLAVGCYGFYLIHVTEAPITKRKRFIVFSKKKLLQISEMQNNLDGSIYVFTGLSDICKNDDQLAFVLAHEIAHVIMSHVEEHISRSYFMEMLVLIPILLFWATMPGEVAVISHWITNRMNHIMITLPFCRSSEIEADYVALQLIAKVGLPELSDPMNDLLCGS